MSKAVYELEEVASELSKKDRIEEGLEKETSKLFAGMTKSIKKIESEIRKAARKRGYECSFDNKDKIGIGLLCDARNYLVDNSLGVGFYLDGNDVRQLIGSISLEGNPPRVSIIVVPLFPDRNGLYKTKYENREVLLRKIIPRDNIEHGIEPILNEYQFGTLEIHLKEQFVKKYEPSLLQK